MFWNLQQAEASFSLSSPNKTLLVHSPKPSTSTVTEAPDEVIQRMPNKPAKIVSKQRIRLEFL